MARKRRKQDKNDVSVKPAVQQGGAAAASAAPLPIVAFWRKHEWWLPATVVAGLYFVLMALLYPYRDVFEFDPDEGIRLIIAKLMHQGHALYADIFNDQPPLFSYLTVWWCDLFGWSVPSSRLLVLLTAAMTLWAMYDMLRLTWGHGAGLMAPLLLIVSHRFMRLSISHMIGLPAIGFAIMAAWALLRWTHHRRGGWLVASGALMGCSILTKAFAGYVLPLMGVWILLVALSWQRRGDAAEAAPPTGQAEAERAAAKPKLAPAWLTVLMPAAIWSLAVVGFCALVLLLTVPWSEFAQLWHSKVHGTDVYSQELSRRIMHGNIANDAYLRNLAIVGTLLIAVRGTWRLMLLPAWVALTYVVLYNHSPVWYHYHLLLSMPGCLLAGVAVGDLLSTEWRPSLSLRYIGRIVLRVVALVFFIGLLGQVAGGKKQLVEDYGFGAHDQHRFVVDVARAFEGKAETIVTDRQMYAFKTDLHLPPEMAVTSLMRIETDPNFFGDFVASIARHDAGVLAFGRTLRPYADVIVAALGDRYVPLYEADRECVYVLPELLDDPIAVLQQAVDAYPNVSAGHASLGLQLAKRGDRQAALAAYEQAMRCSPPDATAMTILADAWTAQGRAVEASQMLQQGYQRGAARMSLSFPRHIAWRLATAPDARRRDGQSAAAMMANLGNVAPLGAKVPMPVDHSIMAAALAAQGQFDPAQAAAQAGLQALAELDATQSALGERLRRQLDLYARGELLLEPVEFPQAR